MTLQEQFEQVAQNIVKAGLQDLNGMTIYGNREKRLEVMLNELELLKRSYSLVHGPLDDKQFSELLKLNKE